MSNKQLKNFVKSKGLRPSTNKRALLLQVKVILEEDKYLLNDKETKEIQEHQKLSPLQAINKWKKLNQKQKNRLFMLSILTAGISDTFINPANQNPVEIFGNDEVFWRLLESFERTATQEEIDRVGLYLTNLIEVEPNLLVNIRDQLDTPERRRDLERFDVFIGRLRRSEKRPIIRTIRDYDRSRSRERGQIQLTGLQRINNSGIRARR